MERRRYNIDNGIYEWNGFQKTSKKPKFYIQKKPIVQKYTDLQSFDNSDNLFLQKCLSEPIKNKSYFTDKSIPGSKNKISNNEILSKQKYNTNDNYKFTGFQINKEGIQKNKYEYFLAGTKFKQNPEKQICISQTSNVYKNRLPKQAKLNDKQIINPTIIEQQKGIEQQTNVKIVFKNPLSEKKSEIYMPKKGVEKNSALVSKSKIPTNNFKETVYSNNILHASGITKNSIHIHPTKQKNNLFVTDTNRFDRLIFS